MSTVYYGVFKNGAAQKMFDHADITKAFAAAVAYAEDRMSLVDYREHDVREIVKDSEGNNVFEWTKGPVTVTVREFQRSEGPYQYGKVMAKWVGGVRVALDEVANAH